MRREKSRYTQILDKIEHRPFSLFNIHDRKRSSRAIRVAAIAVDQGRVGGTVKVITNAIPHRSRYTYGIAGASVER
jgi:hypothetical protein